MKVLELFSGTESFSKVARERGHEVFTVDIDPQFKPSLCKDIMEIKAQEIIEKFGKPDVIWASPPCTKFSVMTIYRNWNKDGTPKNEETIQAQKIVKHTLKLIKELNPKFYIIENPRGMLRKQDFMLNLPRKTVTYCQYGMEYQKATDLWNNLIHWNPKPMCSPKSPCHVRAPRGSRYGIQGVDGLRKNREQKHLDISRMKDYGKNRASLHPKDLYASMEYNWDGSARIRRGMIPKALCLEILENIEANIKKTRGSTIRYDINYDKIYSQVKPIRASQEVTSQFVVADGSDKDKPVNSQKTDSGKSQNKKVDFELRSGNNNQNPSALQVTTLAEDKKEQSRFITEQTADSYKC